MSDDPSSHGRFLRSVGSTAGDFVLPTILYAVIAIYFGRKGVIAEENRKAQVHRPPDSSKEP